MKKDLSHLEKFRVFTQFMAAAPPGCFGGAFSFPYKGKILNTIATDGKGDPDLLKPEYIWEHVSCHALDPVFRKEQVPTWEQMAYVASLFWDDDECIIQYRPPKSDYVNHHPCVLHWWRPVHLEIPLPPKGCV